MSERQHVGQRSNGNGIADGQPRPRVVEHNDTWQAAVGWSGLDRKRRESVVDGHTVDQAVPGHVDVLDERTGLSMQDVDTDDARDPDSVGARVERGISETCPGVVCEPISRVHRQEEESDEPAERVARALRQHRPLAAKMMFWLPPCGVITEK